MAIVVENEYNGSGKKTASVTVASVVVPTSSNRAIYVVIGGVTKNASDGKYATGVSFNGTEIFTKLGEAQNAQGTVAIWYLLNPTETTADIVVTLVDNNASWEGMGVGVQVLSGVDVGGTPHDSWQTPNTGNSLAPSLSLLTATDDYNIGVIAIDNTGGSNVLTESGDGTQIWQYDGGKALVGSQDFVAIDGSTAFLWSLDIQAEPWIHAGISINPAAGTLNARVSRSVRYVVQFQGRVGRSARYSVIYEARVSRSARYGTTPFVANARVSRSTRYSLEYTGRMSRSARYFLEYNARESRQARYAVVYDGRVSRSARYEAMLNLRVSRSTRYAVIYENRISISARYAVIFEARVSRSARYGILPQGLNARVSRSARYTSLILSGRVSRSTRYALEYNARISRSARYTSIEFHDRVSRSTRYIVQLQGRISRSARYAIQFAASEARVSRQARYAIIYTARVSRSVRYQVQYEARVSRSTRYIIVYTNRVSRSARYTSLILSGRVSRSVRYLIETGAPSARVSRSTKYIVTGISLGHSIIVYGQTSVSKTVDF